MCRSNCKNRSQKSSLTRSTAFLVLAGHNRVSDCCRKLRARAKPKPHLRRRKYNADFPKNMGSLLKPFEKFRSQRNEFMFLKTTGINTGGQLVTKHTKILFLERRKSEENVEKVI